MYFCKMCIFDWGCSLLALHARASGFDTPHLHFCISRASVFLLLDEMIKKFSDTRLHRTPHLHFFISRVSVFLLVETIKEYLETHLQYTSPFLYKQWNTTRQSELNDHGILRDMSISNPASPFLCKQGLSGILGILNFRKIHRIGGNNQGILGESKTYL